MSFEPLDASASRSSLRGAVRCLGFLCAAISVSFAVGCKSESNVPFKRVFRTSVENSPNHGYAWVPHRSPDKFPESRYDAGFDAQFHAALGVCRVTYAGGFHPGKVFGGRCNLGYGGSEIVVDQYDVLVARQDAFWHIPATERMDLKDALVGGQEANGTPLYVCVARHLTGWAILKQDHGHHPGKYVAGKCNFGFGGKETSADEFFILATGAPLPGATASPEPAQECIKGEVACSCRGFKGCSRPGYCLCAADDAKAAEAKDAAGTDDADDTNVETEAGPRTEVPSDATVPSDAADDARKF